MAKIIDANHLFHQEKDQLKLIRDKLEYYRNFLLLYEGIDGYLKYYLTFHKGLFPEDEFVDINCPHCGYELNEDTMNGKRVFAHGKINATDLYDRSQWGILEAICPHCDEKVVVILE